MPGSHWPDCKLVLFPCKMCPSMPVHGRPPWIFPPFGFAGEGRPCSFRGSVHYSCRLGALVDNSRPFSVACPCPLRGTQGRRRSTRLLFVPLRCALRSLFVGPCTSRVHALRLVRFACLSVPCRCGTCSLRHPQVPFKTISSLSASLFKVLGSKGEALFINFCFYSQKS